MWLCFACNQATNGPRQVVKFSVVVADAAFADCCCCCCCWVCIWACVSCIRRVRELPSPNSLSLSRSGRSGFDRGRHFILQSSMTDDTWPMDEFVIQFLCAWIAFYLASSFPLLYLILLIPLPQPPNFGVCVCVDCWPSCCRFYSALSLFLSRISFWPLSLAKGK